MEIPNARSMQEGHLRFNFSGSFPNEYTSLTASPFEWLEATYRYTEIKDKKYGPAAYSGNQSYKDKGFDLKFKILNESHSLPAISAGLRDLGGTGITSSEYIVASKRINNLDFSLGLGWGLLGSEKSLNNPFTNLSESFREREPYSGLGGEFSYSSWFSGDTSLFGGLEYYIPRYGLKLNIEYDTSNPDQSGFVEKVENRFNLGFDYFLSESLTLSAAVERGEVYRIGFNLKGNFVKDSIPKPKPKTVQRLSTEQLNRAKNDKQIFYRSLNKSLRDEQIFIQAANYNEDSVDVAVSSSRFFSATRTAGRTARIVSALSPQEVKKINIHSMNGDLEVNIMSLNREEFDQASINNGSVNEILYKSKLYSSKSKPLHKEADFMPKVLFPDFNWNMSPSLKHQIGGPEGFYLGQLLWKTDASIKFNRNLTLHTSFGVNIYDTFNDFRNPSQSIIPHVRSDVQEYLKEGKNNIQRFKLEYLTSLDSDLYARFDFGLIEEMFGGLGGEILYRPFNRKSAFGLSLHKLKQREYRQRFGFLDYETTTGHFSIYTDWPNKISSQLMFGKYLAGDKGFTLDLSRRFDTGFILGVFATKTNLTPEEFGEGSFDKGFYFSIPTKLFYADYKSGSISFGIHPLTKDGGALLNQHNSLFSILGDTNKQSILRDWKYIME